jgi:uncharacterized membrane protein
MIFLAVLIVATAAASVVLAVRRRYSSRHAARFGMALAMAVAGITHWVNPTPFVQHLPTWIPVREEVIFLTGVMEVALGAALLLRQPWRRLAGFALAGYLLAVFPANIYVAVADVEVDGQPGGAYSWLRLPLQAVFIVWAIWCTQDHATSSLSVGTPSLRRARDLSATGS